MPLRVMSYNILADTYASRRLFPTIDPDILSWRSRGRSIVSRFTQLNPDLAGMQEVQESHWPELQAAFAKAGWSGIYQQKGNVRPDGCAILYRSETLRLLSTEALFFRDGQPNHPSSGHLALIASFDTPLGLISFATTHLRWQAQTPDPQAHIGYRQALELLEKCGTHTASFSATILSGDFNVSPSTPIPQLFEQYGFKDVYASQPHPTCNPNHHAVRIDYMFAAGKLRFSPVPIPHIADNTPLPTQSEPSDHLPLTAVFDREPEPSHTKKPSRQSITSPPPPAPPAPSLQSESAWQTPPSPHPR